MSKTLKDLNWSLYTVNIILALFGAILVIVGNDIVTWKGIMGTLLVAVAKDNISFFSDAKKQLERESK